MKVRWPKGAPLFTVLYSSGLGCFLLGAFACLLGGYLIFRLRQPPSGFIIGGVILYGVLLPLMAFLRGRCKHGTIGGAESPGSCDICLEEAAERAIQEEKGRVQAAKDAEYGRLLKECYQYVMEFNVQEDERYRDRLRSELAALMKLEPNDFEDEMSKVFCSEDSASSFGKLLTQMIAGAMPWR